MVRSLLPRLGVLALASFLLSASNAAAATPSGPPAPLPLQAQPIQAQSSQALVGTWSARVNWNLPGGIIITTSFTANGRVQSTTNNGEMSFMLTVSTSSTPPRAL